MGGRSEHKWNAQKLHLWAGNICTQVGQKWGRQNVEKERPNDGFVKCLDSGPRTEFCLFKDYKEAQCIWNFVGIRKNSWKFMVLDVSNVMSLI